MIKRIDGIRKERFLIDFWISGSIMAIAGFFLEWDITSSYQNPQHSAFDLAVNHGWISLWMLLASILFPFAFVCILTFSRWHPLNSLRSSPNFQNACLISLGSAIALPLIWLSPQLWQESRIGLGFYVCEAGNFIAALSAFGYLSVLRYREPAEAKCHDKSIDEMMGRHEAHDDSSKRYEISTRLIYGLCLSACIISLITHFLPWFYTERHNEGIDWQHLYFLNSSGFDRSIGMELYYGGPDVSYLILFSIPIAAILTIIIVTFSKKFSRTSLNILWNIDFVVLGAAISSSLGLMLDTVFAFPLTVYTGRSYISVIFSTLLDSWVICIVATMIMAISMAIIFNRKEIDFDSMTEYPE